VLVTVLVVNAPDPPTLVLELVDVDDPLLDTPAYPTVLVGLGVPVLPLVVPVVPLDPPVDALPVPVLNDDPTFAYPAVLAAPGPDVPVVPVFDELDEPLPYPAVVVPDPLDPAVVLGVVVVVVEPVDPDVAPALLVSVPYPAGVVGLFVSPTSPPTAAGFVTSTIGRTPGDPAELAGEPMAYKPPVDGDGGGAPLVG
jgi:hypothetical protein